MVKLRSPYVVVTAAYCAVIYYLSSLPDTALPNLSFPGADKAVHAVMYGGLAATLWYGLRRSNEEARRAVLVGVPLVFALLYGLIDEYHQLHVPGRAFDWLDWVADAVGAAVALGGVSFWDRNHSLDDEPTDS